MNRTTAGTHAAHALLPNHCQGVFVSGALKRSVQQLLDGDHSRRIAVTLRDGAGRFSGELVSIDHGTVTLVVVDSDDHCGLLSCPEDLILSVELLGDALA